MSAPRVQTGLDALVAERFAMLRGQRVGAICNQSSVDHRLRHLADLLHESADVPLVALFGPEHGIRGDAQDMIGVESAADPVTGVPVFSLYGSDPSSLAPNAEQLDGLDALVFDVQDVGSRYYTFAATMLYAMRVAAGHGLRFLVLDRPNPIGGLAIEGPTIQPGFSSFVGPHPTPIRHGLTVGELAHLFRAELSIDVDLAVVPCRGWSRGMLWGETALPWVAPSPNMPTPDTALIYPGGCLVEGTNLSEGRGTTRPFEWWGAPWLDGRGLAEDTQAWLHVIGSGDSVLLRPAAFRPMFHKHAGTLCHGVQPHVLDAAGFRPVATYAALIALARAEDPERFAWRTEPYEFVREPIAIDLLFGSSAERHAMESDRPLDALADLSRGEWARNEAEFRQRRGPYLLY